MTTKKELIKELENYINYRQEKKDKGICDDCYMRTIKVILEK